MTYHLTLHPSADAAPILADTPDYVEPLAADCRFTAAPLVDDPNGTLAVRSWRYWYNVRGIVEFDNRLDPAATAVVMVHPWGIDDGPGLVTPAPAGVAFFCTVEKNRLAYEHMRQVVSPFLASLRGHVAATGYSLPGIEDPIRKMLYASVDTPPEALNIAAGQKQLRQCLDAWSFTAEPLIAEMELGTQAPVRDYFAHAPSTEASDRYNGAGFWDLPMPLSSAIEHDVSDLVFYDAQGYPKVRDYFKSRGIRHILLCGYCTDMCVKSTTCGYENFSKDFNVFIVGDATLATFPASTTPRFTTQAALTSASLTQMITQISWIRQESHS